ncbi:hypothetical protein FHS85_004808 [Rhodoligotrophos appendicifer]|uniref:hypothetical protein n=1 Tax=Rhodoligotrophos appendicifer TaxID=987056 RepID=UPI001184A61A|nr:hypothetical protein [Rhodoligotrophos appendicifer]
MNKILEAQDRLGEARNLVEAIYMASHNLTHEECGAIGAVATVAMEKIQEAVKMLEGGKDDSEQ